MTETVPLCLLPLNWNNYSVLYDLAPRSYIIYLTSSWISLFCIYLQTLTKRQMWSILGLLHSVLCIWFIKTSLDLWPGLLCTVKWSQITSRYILVKYTKMIVPYYPINTCQYVHVTKSGRKVRTFLSCLEAEESPENWAEGIESGWAWCAWWRRRSVVCVTRLLVVRPGETLVTQPAWRPLPPGRKRCFLPD